MTTEFRAHFYEPTHYYQPVYYYPPAYGTDRWKCPDCQSWVAWWVNVHKCLIGYSTTTSNTFFYKADE